MSIETRHCNHCDADKPVAEFYMYNKTCCKVCVRRTNRKPYGYRRDAELPRRPSGLLRGWGYR